LTLSTFETCTGGLVDDHDVDVCLLQLRPFIDYVVVVALKNPPLIAKKRDVLESQIASVVGLPDNAVHIIDEKMNKGSNVPKEIAEVRIALISVPGKPAISTGALLAFDITNQTQPFPTTILNNMFAFVGGASQVEGLLSPPPPPPPPTVSFSPISFSPTVYYSYSDDSQIIAYNLALLVIAATVGLALF